MNIKSTAIKLVPIDSIKLNPRNRNAHSPEQIEQFVKILAYQGFRIPGTVSNQSGYLAAGELRYLALKKMGQTIMPIMFQDFDDAEQEYLFGVSDNEIAKQSILDLSTVHLDLQNMGPFDLDLLGIKDFSFTPTEIEPEPEKEKTDPTIECPKCGHVFSE